MTIVEYQIPEWDSLSQSVSGMEAFFRCFSPSPRFTDADQKDHLVRWAFPDELLEAGNISQHLKVFTADDGLPLFSKILWIRYSEKQLQAFSGAPGSRIDLPSFSWIYELSLSKLEKNIEEVFHVAKTGAAACMDSPLLTSLSENIFKERLEILRKESLTYIPNVSSPDCFEMEKRMNMAAEGGLSMVSLLENDLITLTTGVLLASQRKMTILGKASALHGKSFLVDSVFSAFLLQLLGFHGIVIDAKHSSKSLMNLFSESTIIHRVHDMPQLLPLVQMRSERVIILTDLPRMMSEGLQTGSEKITAALKDLSMGRVNSVSKPL